MRSIDIQLGQYLPDLGGAPFRGIPGYLVDALNVRSTPSGYRGLPSFATIPSATTITGSALPFANGACFKNLTGNVIFVLVNASGTMHEDRSEGAHTWEDVTPTGTAPDATGDWLQFGNDMVYISPGRAPIKKSVNDTEATDFSALGGSPPNPSNNGTRIRQHVVVSDGAYTIRTSAIGDHEDWPTPGTADAIAKQSIEEELNSEFGRIIRILGGEKFGIILQERALTRMTYVGGSVVYEFDVYHRYSGSGGKPTREVRPVTDGFGWYWYSETGVYWTDGFQVRNLSHGKIEEALFANTIGHPNGTSLTVAASAAYDQRRGLVIFGGQGSGSSTYKLVYNVRDESFSLMNSADEMSMFNGYILSGTWPDNGPHVYNVKLTDKVLQRLDGAPGTVALQTGYIEVAPGYRVQLHGVEILGNGVPGSLAIAYKAASDTDDLGVSQSGFTSLTAAPRGNMFTARATAQYFAFRITGSMTEAQLLRGLRVHFSLAEPG